MSRPAKKNRRKGRRALRWAGALLVASGAVWLLVERYVMDVDRYRELVVAEIEDSTGLAATIGRLELDVLGGLQLRAHEVTVGDGNFMARAERVTIEAKLLPLLQRRVDITSAQLVGLTTRLPKNPAKLSERVREVIETASKPAEREGPGFEVSIAEIVVNDGALFFGSDSESTARVSFTLGDVLTDDISFNLSADSSVFGEKAMLEYELRIAQSDGEIVSINGLGKLSGIETGGLGLDGAPEGIFSATLTMEGAGPKEIDFKLNGAFESDVYTALAGTVLAEAAWREDGLNIHEASWTSPDLNVQGNATLDREGTLNLRVVMAEAGPMAINEFAAMASFDHVLPVASRGAGLGARNVLLEIPPEGGARFTSGELTFHGVGLDNAEGAALVEGIRGRLAFEEGGLIRIDEFVSDDFSLQGTLRPVLEEPSLGVDLRGRATIRPGHIAAVLGDDVVGGAQGNIVLARLAGTFGTGRGIPEDLVLEGTIQEARLVLKRENREIRLGPIAGEFTTTSEGIRTILTAASPDIGTVNVDGQYGLEEQEWLGRISADLPRLISGFLPEDSISSSLDLVLAKYGQSTFWADLAFPTQELEGIHLHLRREGTPRLEGRVAFVPAPSGGTRLGAIEAESNLPLEGMAEEIFNGVAAVGEARMTFARDPETMRFEFLADLGQAAVRAGDYIEKRHGDALRIRITGDAGETWAVREARVDVLDASVAIELAEDGAASVSLKVDVGHLAGLLPEGSTAQGTIMGEFTSAPRAGRLAFEQVGFTIDSERQVHSIDGTLEIAGENISIRDFRIVGANSECVLTATRLDGLWEGSLKGPSLDLGWVEVLGNEVGAFWRENDGSSSGSSLWDDPLLGEFYIHFDKMYYRRGVVDAMTARVIATDREILFQDLYLRPYTGKLTGTITIASEAGVDALVSVALEVDEIDGRILDEILYDEPGEVHGTISGTVNLTAPLGEPKKMMAAADGGVVWNATEGSLGKLGFATKLLTALKTVEVINLKVPSLRDEGLTYKTFTGEAKMSAGVMSFEDVILDGGAYELEAKGEVDFALEKTDVTVHVHALQSVSNIVEKVPVLGEITKLTTDLVGVTVLMKGSPYDLETIVVPGGDNIFENTKELGEKAVEGVTRILKKLIPGGEKPKNDE